MSTLLPLPQRLTHAEAPAFLAQARVQVLQLAQGAALQLDASALQAFDSSAVAVLLALRRTAQAAGGALQVQGTPPRLRDLLVLYGVGELLPA